MMMLLSLAAALIASAAQAQTVLKPGDTLSITILQDATLNRSVMVDSSGQIAFPLAGHIQAEGLTLEALEKVISDKLKGNYKVDRLDVTADITSHAPKTVDEVIKPQVYITGEVLKPGSYIYPEKRPMTVMQAIAMAGGFGPYAAKNRVQVRRAGIDGQAEQIFNFDYRAYETGRNTSANILLNDGDVVVIPERRLFE
jgi:polysaccharide export outer membrane protein